MYCLNPAKGNQSTSQPRTIVSAAKPARIKLSPLCTAEDLTKLTAAALLLSRKGYIGVGQQLLCKSAGSVDGPPCKLQSMCVLHTLVRLQPGCPSLPAAPSSSCLREAAGLMCLLLLTKQQPSCSEHRIVSWAMAAVAELAGQKKHSLQRAVVEVTCLHQGSGNSSQG